MIQCLGLRFVLERHMHPEPGTSVDHTSSFILKLFWGRCSSLNMTYKAFEVNKLYDSRALLNLFW